MRVKYLTQIYWSDVDNCYLAEIPALPGCASHGNTFAQAAKNIHEAAELWLETAIKFNEEIPASDFPESDSTVKEMYRFSPVLNMSKLARLSGVNRNTLVSKLRRRTRFTKSESNRLLKVLRSL